MLTSICLGRAFPLISEGLRGMTISSDRPMLIMIHDTIVQKERSTIDNFMQSISVDLRGTPWDST